MNRSARPRGRVSGAPGEELERTWRSRTKRTEHAVSESGRADATQQTQHMDKQQQHKLYKLTFRLQLFLGRQIHRGRHGHGGHTEAGGQRFHGARHHPQPRPSLSCSKPLAPRRRASKRLVVPALQRQAEKRRETSDWPVFNKPCV